MGESWCRDDDGVGAVDRRPEIGGQQRFRGTAFHVAGKLDPAVCGDRLEFAFPPGIQPDLMAKQGHVASDGLADVSGTDDCKFAHGVYFVHAGVLDAPLAGRVRECVRAALFRAQSI